jgi:hypothetical protein
LSAKFPDLFLTCDILLLRYQMALVVESGRFEKVLWQQVSHLLLKYTKSGNGTAKQPVFIRFLPPHFLLMLQC